MGGGWGGTMHRDSASVIVMDKSGNLDLKRLYKKFLEGKVCQSHSACPPPEWLVKFFRFKLSRGKKRRLIDHISQCPHCSQEFKFMLEIFRQEKIFIKDIENILHPRTPGKKLAPSREKMFALRPIRASALLSLLALAVAAAALFFLLKFPRDQFYRESRLSAITLIGPVGGDFFSSDQRFKWSIVSDFNYCILEIFDETLLPMWKTEKIYGNQWDPPYELTVLLKKDKLYFWMVTVFLPQGGQMESRLEDFVFH